MRSGCEGARARGKGSGGGGARVFTRRGVCFDAGARGPRVREGRWDECAGRVRMARVFEARRADTRAHGAAGESARAGGGARAQGAGVCWRSARV